MTTTVRTTAVKRTPMSSLRKTALVAGALYVITFAASIPAVLLPVSYTHLTLPTNREV